MANLDIDPKVLIVGVIGLAFIASQLLDTAGGAGRTVAGGVRGVYRDVTGVPKAAYRDVAKPIGRAGKSVARSAYKSAGKAKRGAVGWLKRRF